jgi:D-mannonate dehydratase
MELSYCEHFDLYSKPGESHADFKLRLQQRFREERDAETEKIRKRYESKIAAAEERVRKAQAVVEKKQGVAQQSKFAAFLSFLTSIIPTILKFLAGKGRGKSLTATDISRGTSAARGAGRAMQTSADVGRAEEDRAAAEQKLAALKSECDEECRAKVEQIERAIENIETVEAKTTRSNINVKLLALAWLPYYANETQNLGKAY